MSYEQGLFGVAEDHSTKKCAAVRLEGLPYLYQGPPDLLIKFIHVLKVVSAVMTLDWGVVPSMLYTWSSIYAINEKEKFYVFALGIFVADR